MKIAFDSLILSFCAVLSLSITACTVTPDAGHEAVLIENPIIFGRGGVDTAPITTGLTFIAPSDPENGNTSIRHGRSRASEF